MLKDTQNSSTRIFVSDLRFFFLSESYKIHYGEIPSGKAYHKLTKNQRFQVVWTVAINNTLAATWPQTDAIRF